MIDEFIGKPIVIRHDAGKRFVATARTHEIVTDQAEKSGGLDSGATPLELLGAALGSCIALYVQQFCEVRHIPHTGMEVEVRQANEKNPSRVSAFSVRLVMPESLPVQYVSILERVIKSCPVHNTLAEGATVSIDIPRLLGADV